MDSASIITLGTEVAKVLNNILSNMPTYEQKKMENFFEFLDFYETEVKKADADFDRQCAWILHYWLYSAFLNV